ncbi:MAG: SDR family NAD(P)-dependent oxidoreductase [Litorivicinaceae bacterium]|nr:SDR family NAD(P)-dependent oxidoreductase [Litorivicinaceae bacterium]
MIKRVDFSGKTALITGATGAIGSAVAKRLAQEKVNLILISSGEDRLNKLKEDFSSHDIETEGIICDLSSLTELTHLINNELKNRRVDILINSAGVFPNKPIHEMKPEDYLSVLNVNLNAAYLLCASMSSGMVQSSWGRIVNVGSSSCYSGFRNTTAYCVSKHGMLGLSRSLHDELKDLGVRVYNISPSSTQGRMGLATVGQDYSTFLDPDEVADYIMFVISHDGNVMSEEVFLKRMLTSPRLK